MRASSSLTRLTIVNVLFRHSPVAGLMMIPIHHVVELVVGILAPSRVKSSLAHAVEIVDPVLRAEIRPVNSLLGLLVARLALILRILLGIWRPSVTGDANEVTLRVLLEEVGSTHELAIRLPVLIDSFHVSRVRCRRAYLLSCRVLLVLSVV